ncbi:MAG: SDR family oxidoreductase [Bacteroidetes bacterium]|nr:SDR family oxidoreductase [Bacteroidota bacterium]
MKILLTGATGYIGKRLLPVLVNKGHFVYCCVRDKNRFHPPESLKEHIEILELDFLNESSLLNIPIDIDAAYYLMHSMASAQHYDTLELKSASNFRLAVNKTAAKHVIYLGGIVNDTDLSKHLFSRKIVELELFKGSYQFTSLRAGIIIGSGSASFEIIRDLTEKLPIMVAPKWLNTKCQPIAVRDVISFLSECLMNSRTFGKNFDIGGSTILTYKEMLLGYAKVRGLKRRIVTLPFMTPKLSSYWLFFITSTSYKLASALVDSMKVEVVCRKSNINELLGIEPLSYEKALKRTFKKIQDQQVLSSWKDAVISSRKNLKVSDFIQVPVHGCYIDKRSRKIKNIHTTIDKIWKIGGNTGWYFGDFLWEIRGLIDKMFGGVGLRRGRTHDFEINTGDALDFWRVIYASKEEGRLLLFAEMKLPGEAWLEFKIINNRLWQTATFRPKGITARLYWYSLYPIHLIIFNGMIRKLTA